MYYSLRFNLITMIHHHFYFAGKDSCRGDSGGPLVAMKKGSEALNKNPKYLVGIASFGTRSCGKGLPGVYTSIDYYIHWIIDHMKP